MKLLGLLLNRSVAVAGSVVLLLAGPGDLGAQPAATGMDVVEFSKLLPLLPAAPEGWTAEEAEGSSDDTGGFQVANVHRDYRKGEGENIPTTSISILDAAGNPEYVKETTAAWDATAETPEGYTKALTIEGNPAFETFEKEERHGSLWVIVANRYLLQIETQGQDAKELQEWVKRIDLKKLAEIN